MIMNTTQRNMWIRMAAASVAVAALAACGGGDETTAATGGGSAVLTTSHIVIEGTDTMRFIPNQFAVKAGDEITLVFRNTGTMPKESMGHNLAVLDGTVAPNTFSAAAISHPANEYIPPQFENKVIATTVILGPGEEETLVFAAPAEPGEYPFVCSFPGHTEAGMRGVMTVVE